MIAASFMVAVISGTACDHLAADIRRRAADTATFIRPLDAPQARLTRPMLAPVIRLAAADTNGPAALPQQLAALFPDESGGSVFALYRIGSLQQAVWLGGTLHCATEGLFVRRADGSLEKRPAPPAYSDLCWTDYRQLGTADGRPAMVEINERDHPYLGYDVEVTPWTGAWGTPCGLRVRYDDRFTLAERFCDGEAKSCAAGAALAPTLAEALARGTTGARLQAIVAAPPATATDAASFAAASARLTDEGDEASLPTFGAKPQTEFPDWSYPTERVRVVLNGTTLLMRVGIGGVGWRQIGDYLVALYRLDGGTPTPVAGYVVRRTVTGLRQAAVFRPVPHHDNR